MSVGSFSFFPGGGNNLGGNTVPLAVFKNIDGNLYGLPNVFPVSVSFTEGDDPPTARFAYVMDDRAQAMGWPTRFEQLWPLRTTDANDVGPYVVLPDDRICCYANFPDGSFQCLFDGYSRAPQVNVDGSGQHVVTFGAVDAAIRCYDIPIQGRVQRNGSTDQIEETDGSEDVPTNLPTHFNPVVGDSGNPTGQPNCTPEGFDTDPDGEGQGVSYPVFLDPRIDRPTDPDHSPRPWTLSGAVRYLLATCNPGGSPPPEDDDDPSADTFDAIVRNPDFTDLDTLLDNRQPKDMFFDPNDPGTYTANPIVIRDFDATNMAWPEALARLLGYHGFGMRWVLGMDDDGLPVHTFEVYRKDAGNAITPKVLYLPPQGSPLVPGSANVGTLAAAFDYHSVANSIVVETHPNRWEVSVILAPLFKIEPDDFKAEYRKAFLRSALDNADENTRKAYRWYGVDELGDGYWDLKAELGDEWTEGKPFDFSPLWPDGKDPDTGEAERTYVTRLRPGTRDCLADDGKGDRLKAQLALSRNYKGKFPAFWDGTGDWQPIEGDWKLLDDRLGIEFTADDPEAIHCGKAAAPTSIQNSGAILKGVKSISDPQDPPEGKSFHASAGLFFLRLTCVIEADGGIEAAATKRLASPMGNEIRRRIDAKDHFRKDAIHTSSAFHSEQVRVVPDTPMDKQGNLLPRDDTQVAIDHAMQLRSAHEFPSCPIAVTIPSLSLSYGCGDRVSYIAGRDVSLQTNAGTEQQEGASFPFIVGVTFDFSGDAQQTVLQLSDRRMEPQPIEQRRGPQGNR